MSCVDYFCNILGDFYSVFYNMCRKETIRLWNPCDIILQGSSSNQYVVMILNRPICPTFNQRFILNLWHKAKLRVTVDGGSDHWLSWLQLNNYDQCKDVAPDFITGDMDSLSDEVLQYFIAKNSNIRVIKTPDQNETDFTKAIREVQQHILESNLKVNTIIALVDTSGRFDQIIGNVNTLFKARKILPDFKILLLASDSLSWLLTEGVIHTINIPVVLQDNKEWCALIPIGSPCKVTTTGLKWNLNNTVLEFGSLVSTSNTYNGNSSVTIQTDKPLMWSMGIKDLF